MCVRVHAFVCSVCVCVRVTNNPSLPLWTQDRSAVNDVLGDLTSGKVTSVFMETRLQPRFKDDIWVRCCVEHKGGCAIRARAPQVRLSFGATAFGTAPGIQLLGAFEGVPSFVFGVCGIGCPWILRMPRRHH